MDFKVVLVNDNSYGADGIVVQDGINSIEDLKGKTVATEVGTLEHMFLLKILEENNICLLYTSKRDIPRYKKDHKGCTGYRCKSHPSGIRIFE